MPFISYKAPTSKEAQRTIWEILKLYPKKERKFLVRESSNTITHYYNDVPESLKNDTLVRKLINNLNLFNDVYKNFIEEDNLQSHYTVARIPKKTVDNYGRRKFRTINMPDKEITIAHTQLKAILSMAGCPTHHTAAFGYVEGRAPADVSKKHQFNSSNWWLLTDIHDFFGSITYEFVLNTLSNLYPYSEILKQEMGAKALKNALKICFLNNGLPQGTVISPFLTNLVMIPFDYMMSKDLRGDYVYTRYSDDIQISSRVKFNKDEVLDIINNNLKRIQAPFKIAPEKTRFKNGAVFVLGVMYNEKHERTVGHKNKKSFKATLFSYLADRAKGIYWGLHELQSLYGNYNYYKGIEPEYFTNMFKQYGKKFGVNVETALRGDISRC